MTWLLEKLDQAAPAFVLGSIAAAWAVLRWAFTKVAEINAFKAELNGLKDGMARLESRYETDIAEMKAGQERIVDILLRKEH